MKTCLRIISAWLMMSVVTLKSEAQDQESGSGDTSDMLMPEETVSPSIAGTSSMTVMTTSKSVMQISPSSTVDNLIPFMSTTEARMPSVSSTTVISPATSLGILLSTSVPDQSETTLPSASVTMPPMDSSSILTTSHGIETTTIFEVRVTTSSVTPTPTVPLPTSINEPTTTTVGTIPTTAPSTEAGVTSSSTTEGEGDSNMSTIAALALSTVHIIIIAIAIVAFLIIVFIIIICVLARLLHKRRKKEDPVRKDILSKWELKEPPKPRGGARLVNIRTLDSMEEIDKAVGFEGSSDREQRYQEPRAFVGGNVGETSDGGNNTAFTFGVPIASAVDKSTGITGETAQTLPEGKQNGRSETVNDRGVQDKTKESANGLKENKASAVTKAPPTTQETTLTTSTFGPAPLKLSSNEVDPKPLNIGANGESGAAVFKEMNKHHLLHAKQDVGRSLGVQGLFQDFPEVSTQL